MSIPSKVSLCPLGLLLPQTTIDLAVTIDESALSRISPKWHHTALILFCLFLSLSIMILRFSHVLECTPLGPISRGWATVTVPLSGLQVFPPSGSPGLESSRALGSTSQPFLTSLSVGWFA